VDWNAEYSALSSTRSQKKKLKQTTQCPFNTVQVKIREVSPEGIRVTMEESRAIFVTKTKTITNEKTKTKNLGQTYSNIVPTCRGTAMRT